MIERAFIYTDSCCSEIEQKVLKELNLRVVKTFGQETWSVNEAMIIITDPQLRLTVINQLDYLTVMEIALLNFMCKKILVTTKTINEYPVILRSVDFVDTYCDLTSEDSQFITWYKTYMT